MHARTIRHATLTSTLAAVALAAPHAHAQSGPGASGTATVAVVARPAQVEPIDRGTALTYDTMKWSFGAAAVVTLGTGVIFQVLASNAAADLERLANQRDPTTGLPTANYADVAATDERRVTNQSFAIAFFALGGACAVTSAVFWLLPREHRVHAPRAALVPTLGGAHFSLTF